MGGIGGVAAHTSPLQVDDVIIITIDIIFNIIVDIIVIAVIISIIINNTAAITELEKVGVLQLDSRTFFKSNLYHLGRIQRFWPNWRILHLRLNIYA